MPREVRELAIFFALVIDTSTKIKPAKLTSTDIKCFEKGCPGTTRVEIMRSSKEIHRMCSRYQNEGRTSHWQGKRWNNIKRNEKQPFLPLVKRPL